MLTFVNEIINSQELISKLSALYEENINQNYQNDVYMQLFEKSLGTNLDLNSETESTNWLG